MSSSIPVKRFHSPCKGQRASSPLHSPCAPCPRPPFPVFPALSRHLLPLPKAVPAPLALDSFTPVLFPSPARPAHPPPRADTSVALPSHGSRSGTSPELLLVNPNPPWPHSVPWNAPHIHHHPKSTLQCWLCLFWWFPNSSPTQELQGDPKLCPRGSPLSLHQEVLPASPSPCSAPASSQSHGKSPSFPKHHPSGAL